jgi:hypothetical protein
VIEAARAYFAAGLCPLPAILAEKRPNLPGWKQYQTRRPTERQIEQWFCNSHAICVLTGVVSGNLEMIDFDFEAELFGRWAKFIDAKMPGLLGRLLVERSQSGGNGPSGNARRCWPPSA